MCFLANNRVFIVDDDFDQKPLGPNSVCIPRGDNDIFNKKTINEVFGTDIEFIEVVPSLRTLKRYVHNLLRNYRHK